MGVRAAGFTGIRAEFHATRLMAVRARDAGPDMEVAGPWEDPRNRRPTSGGIDGLEFDECPCDVSPTRPRRGPERQFALPDRCRKSQRAARSFSGCGSHVT